MIEQRISNLLSTEEIFNTHKVPYEVQNFARRLTLQVKLWKETGKKLSFTLYINITYKKKIQVISRTFVHSCCFFVNTYITIVRTLLSLLRIPIFCHFGSTSFVLPIRPKNSILNRDRRVEDLEEIQNQTAIR